MDVCDARANQRCEPSQVRWDAAGLRVALSSHAKSVCVLEQGCAEGPKGAISIQPLKPQFRQAISEALTGLGFELVDVESDRDIVADVEWRGTDTIALRLQDVHGRVIEGTSFSRSLERCRQLTELNWDSCWAANFDVMKQALARPLERSAALLAFARKTKGMTRDGDGQAPEATVRPSASTVPGAATAVTEHLNAAQLQETVARYRKEMERNCWLPALESRDPSASTSARVAVSVTINASGSVDRVTTAGDPPGYLHLASCIAVQVRGWRFPPTTQGTTANIPFVFASD